MSEINNLLWSIATILLLGSGIYFSYKLDFLHLNFKRIFKSFMDSSKEKNGISPFQSLAVALGGCIGVGSLAGIALAIYKGGVGTIFWIWLSCLLVVPNSLVENTLAIIYQKKIKNEYIGGPSYYIKNGLGYKKLSLFYALLVTFTYIFGYLTIQSNTIAKSFTNVFQIPSIVIGLIVGILSFLIIRKGIKGIAKFSSVLVPLMGFVYLLVAMLIVFKNLNMLPSLLISIFKEAFNFSSFGWGLFSVILIGIQRGIFSSEAGTGTAAIASGSSNIDSPIKQGLIQTLGIYFITFIICTSTAFIILMSDYSPLNYTDVNGIEITQNALRYHFGDIGNIILYFCIIAFSFSTIVSGYFYGETNMKFIFKKMNQRYVLILQIVTCLLLIISSVVSPTFLWNFVDILTALLVIINVFSIFSLRKDVIIEYISFKRKCNNDRK
ncbi:MAG: alanine:cation symporter family protein [Bacilli bacterium]|nr:alanine:cation symporter family protein [Bacilli bacterium]